MLVHLKVKTNYELVCENVKMKNEKKNTIEGT